MVREHGGLAKTQFDNKPPLPMSSSGTQISSFLRRRHDRRRGAHDKRHEEFGELQRRVFETKAEQKKDRL